MTAATFVGEYRRVLDLQDFVLVIVLVLAGGRAVVLVAVIILVLDLEWASVITFIVDT